MKQRLDSLRRLTSVNAPFVAVVGVLALGCCHWVKTLRGKDHEDDKRINGELIARMAFCGIASAVVVNIWN